QSFSIHQQLLHSPLQNCRQDNLKSLAAAVQGAAAWHASRQTMAARVQPRLHNGSSCILAVVV
ncbi:MAG: hypothetical protein ACK55I_22980, partial [bacterium]